MNPHSRIVIAGRTWQDEKLITGVKPGQVPRPGTEDCPVNGGPESSWVLGRERGRRAVLHHPPI
ncbi:MAG: hypothetical protein WEE89_00495 [Gemmatimonadota bacterium]